MATRYCGEKSDDVRCEIYDVRSGIFDLLEYRTSNIKDRESKINPGMCDLRCAIFDLLNPKLV